MCKISLPSVKASLHLNQAKKPVFQHCLMGNLMKILSSAYVCQYLYNNVWSFCRNTDVHNDSIDGFPCPKSSNQEGSISFTSSHSMGFTAASEGFTEVVVRQRSVKKKRGRIFDRNTRAAELDVSPNDELLSPLLVIHGR